MTWEELNKTARRKRATKKPQVTTQYYTYNAHSDKPSLSWEKNDAMCSPQS